MNDKIKDFFKKVDETAEKCNSVITEDLDKNLQSFKSKDDIVLNGVEYISSRFGVPAALVCGLLYAILCLKNMVFSFFFKDAPVKMCLGAAIASCAVLGICVYSAAKMMDALPKVINSSSCKMSSFNFFAVMTAIGTLLAAASFIGGIYYAFEFKSFRLFLIGFGGAVFAELIASYAADPEKFGIVEDEKASAGEDFVSIATFFLKVMLRLVPVVLLGISIFGIFQIVPMIFSSYVRSGEDANYLMTMNMMADMFAAARFVFIGLIPLAVYLVYIFYYVALDLIRAILQLPNKLDELKK